MRNYFKLIALLLFLGAAPFLHAETSILVQRGQTIGFMGDSITAMGAAPSGYVGLVIYALKVEGVETIAIPAGVPGHTSANMRGRVEPQILSKGANWMTLSCGVNDVLMKSKGHGVDLEAYKKNVAAMVEACQASNVRVVLMTPTPVGEDLGNENNRQLAEYVEFLRTYGKEKHLLVSDVNAAFQDCLKRSLSRDEKTGARLLADGIHPNQTGQTLMAKTLVLTLGLPPADLPKIEKAWMDNPQGKSIKLGPDSFALISQNQYNALESLAAKTHTSPRSVVAALWKQALEQSTTKVREGPQADARKATESAQAKIGILVDAYLRDAREGK